jgi:prepilin peptidase CpaA
MGAFFSDQIGPLPATALLVVALVCTVTDLWKATIYNAVTYPAALVGLAIQIGLHGWSGGLTLGLGGFAVGFFPAFLLFALGGMQGGDVKLLGAIGALAGPVPTTEVFVVALVLGGAYGLVQMAWRGVLLRRLWQSLRYLAGRLVPGVGRVPLEIDGQNTIRFGVAISLAVLVVLWSLRAGGVLNALGGA